MTREQLPPVFIKLLLDAYCLPEVCIDSPALEQSMERAHHLQLLTSQRLVNSMYLFELTERGRKYVDMLMETPMPVSKTSFVDPRFEKDYAAQDS